MTMLVARGFPHSNLPLYAKCMIYAFAPPTRPRVTVIRYPTSEKSTLLVLWDCIFERLRPSAQLITL